VVVKFVKRHFSKKPSWTSQKMADNELSFTDYLDYVRKATNVTDEDILAVYLFGSRIYGTATKDSGAPPFCKFINTSLLC